MTLDMDLDLLKKLNFSHLSVEVSTCNYVGKKGKSYLYV